jgi:S1-C subfamily serine protease
MASSVITSFSQELAAAAEQVGPSVVTVCARHRVPSSGIHWRQGIVVTADHTIRREDDITILYKSKSVAAKVAGRDPGTDLAVLKLDGDASVVFPQFADASGVKLANVVLALGAHPAREPSR